MKLTVSTLIALTLSSVVLYEPSVWTLSAKMVSMPSVLTEMDREAESFARVKSTVAKGTECLPVRVGGDGQLDVQYLACSDAAFQRDGESFKVSENITVPEPIARRVNFWRRVYSLWSKNQYVMHLAEYPDVVLEIHDSTRIEGLGDKTREKFMKPLIEERRRQYRQILTKLGSIKNIDESTLTPTERRV